MEPLIRFSPDIRNAEADVSEMEGFSQCINELVLKVNELEQGVNLVEQFYMTADNKQPNSAKCRSIVKDKVREKYLANIEEQQNHVSHREAAAEKRMQELMHQFSGIFHQVIEKPMDLGTIKNKMEAKDGTGYKNVREIYADVRLVFKNAMKYNDERDDVHVMARTLLEKFEEKWLQLLPKVAEEEKRLANDEGAAQEAMKLSQEVSHANIARDLSNELCEVDLQLENLRTMVVQKCRKMSVEDKMKLGTALTLLSPEDLTRALEIVADDNPSFQSTAQEVDLDMDAQSESTLWRLRVFVKDALKTKGRKSGGMDGNKNDKNKDNNINNKKSKNIGTAIAANNNNKRRREISDAITTRTTKKTRKISLIS